MVRRYERRDIADVQAIFRELIHLPTETSLEHLLDDMDSRPEVYMNLVAEYEGRVVGFGSVVFFKTLIHPGGKALINELVVKRGFRGKGIGKAIIAHAQQEAIARGMDELEVSTEKENAGAMRFYRSCGLKDESVLLGAELGKRP